MKATRLLALSLVLCFVPVAAAHEGHSDLKRFKDVPHDKLLEIMKGFTAALGKKCDFCHVKKGDKLEPPSGPRRSGSRSICRRTSSIA